MYSSIQTGQSLGMQTLDQNLSDLVRAQLVSPSEARSKAKIPKTSRLDGAPKLASARYPRGGRPPVARQSRSTAGSLIAMLRRAEKNTMERINHPISSTTCCA